MPKCGLQVIQCLCLGGQQVPPPGRGICGRNSWRGGAGRQVFAESWCDLHQAWRLTDSHCQAAAFGLFRDTWGLLPPSRDLEMPNSLAPTSVLLLPPSPLVPLFPGESEPVLGPPRACPHLSIQAEPLVTHQLILAEA